MTGNRMVFAVAVSLLLICSGCSVLTKAQVKEVNTFAAAAREYTEMPGAVIAEHARIRKVRQVLMAATNFNGDAALDAIKLALAQQKELEERQRQTDSALKVLKDYADLLVTLSSDEFTTDLQASAEKLGKSIDKGISRYNEESGRTVSAFGSGIAGVVRGVGGVHLRRQQEEILKSAVTSADPVVREMSRSVEETMALYLDAEQLGQIPNLLQEKERPLTPGELLIREKSAIMDKYRTTAPRFEGRQPPSLPMMVADEMEAADRAAELAARTIVAAHRLRTAHGRLADMVAEKRDLQETVDEVQVLVEEVKAAERLRTSLKNE